MLGLLLIWHKRATPHAKFAHAAHIIKLFHLRCKKQGLCVWDLAINVLTCLSESMRNGCISWCQNTFVRVWAMFWRFLVQAHFDSFLDAFRYLRRLRIIVLMYVLNILITQAFAA